MGSIPESRRCPGEGNDNPLQYSCLENPMDRRTWWATVHGITKESCDDLATDNNKYQNNYYKLQFIMLNKKLSRDMEYTNKT